MTTLPWIHTVVSNLERFIVGRHHAIAGKHAVRYLGEFAYRLNRRRESHCFAMLLDTCTKVRAMTHRELLLRHGSSEPVLLRLPANRGR